MHEKMPTLGLQIASGPAAACPAAGVSGSRSTLPLLAFSVYLVLLCARIGTAQDAELDTPLEATRLVGQIQIDGQLREEAWERAPVHSGFRQFNIDPGAPASFVTEVRVLYDERFLYVGMRMRDPQPDSIAAQLGRRDALDIHSDWAHVQIDSYHDRRSGYVFSLTPKAVQRDGRLFDDTEVDYAWTGVWEGAARIDDEGWVAEFKIPLSQLRFRVGTEGRTEWAVNFGREVARTQEISYWAPVLPDEGRFVSRFVPLRLSGIAEPRHLELMPYAVARGFRQADHGDNPFRDNFDFGGDVGLDIRYGLGPNFTVTATVNPEFGQVEVDPAVINLTAFETFFPERRPFFVEGAEMFQRGIGAIYNPTETLFYSRRIGRHPQLAPPAEAIHADMPTASRIHAAAKLTGRTGAGWSVGALQALTAEERSEFITADDLRSTSAVEPMTNYSVVRTVRDLRGGRSAVGAIVTGTHRKLTEERLDELPSSAYSGGIDGRHRFGSRDHYEATGWLVASYVSGSTSAIDRLQRAPTRYFQRPDAGHLSYQPDRTELSGVAALMGLRKIGGAWRPGMTAMVRSPGLETNDLGFLRSADQMRLSAWLGYVQSAASRSFRSWSVFTNHHLGWTTGGEALPGRSDVNALFQLHNYWQGFVGIRHDRAGLMPEALRGGPALRSASRSGGWIQLTTDPRRWLATSVTVLGQAEHGAPGSNLTVAVGPTIRPSAALQIAATPTWTRVVESQQFVARAATDYVLGVADQRTLSLVTRLNLTFSPTLTLEVFAQPLISTVEYSGFGRAAEYRQAEYARRLVRFSDDEFRELESADQRRRYGYFEPGADEPLFAFADPGFNLRSLRGNAVLRWEYRPGATLFVVWQQMRRELDFGEPLGYGRDLRSMMRLPGDHAIVVKATYWFSR